MKSYLRLILSFVMNKRVKTHYEINAMKINLIHNYILIYVNCLKKKEKAFINNFDRYKSIHKS